jgi:hypothetical protein
VTALREAAHHVGAHAPEPDHPDLHTSPSAKMLLRSRQKPRLLPAATKLMSAEIASCDFCQLNQFRKNPILTPAS